MEKTTVIQLHLGEKINLTKSPYIDGRASDVVVSHNRVADYCNLLITYNVS